MPCFAAYHFIPTRKIRNNQVHCALEKKKKLLRNTFHLNPQLCAVNYKRLNALKCITARSSVPRALSHYTTPGSLNAICPHRFS